MATKGCEWDGVKVSNCHEMKHRKKFIPQLPTLLPKNESQTGKSDKKSGSQTLIDVVEKPLPSGSQDGGSGTRGGLANPPTCNLACSERSSCQNCTNSLCMWCKNLGMCVDRNAYLASFPYGQCMDWTTHSEECPAPLSKDENNQSSTNVTDPGQICSGYKTCDSCRANPSCGWCDEGLGTGIGSCMLGGASGPLVKVRSGHSQAQWVASDTCPSGDGKSWHFTSCPGKYGFILFTFTVLAR